MSEIIPLTTRIPNESKSWAKILRQLGLLSKRPGSFLLGTSKKEFQPVQYLSIGASMWRVFRCDPTCGVCCMWEMTLDYIPGESTDDLEAAGFKSVIITVNDREYPLLTQMSEASKNGGRCRYVAEYPLGEERAIGCARWSTKSPLSCVTAPNIHIQSHGPGTTIISKKPFGRHTMWSVLPRCQFTDYPVEEVDQSEVLRDIELLLRWWKWAEYFELDTWLPEVITIFQDVKSGRREPESIRVV